ncbi:kinesin-related protein [Gracilaria domingensis]|nr:kinesin-related protein [Gracilaria domingensis]
MESQSRPPLKEILTGAKDNLTATQTQRPLGVSKSKHMINKVPPKSTNASSAIPEPPSRRQTSVRTRSTTTASESVNKRLAAKPKRSFSQQPRPKARTVSRPGTEASRRDTLPFNRTNASRTLSRGLTATRPEAIPAADKKVFTQFTSILERVDQSVQSLKESKDSVEEGASERLLETISQLESVRPEYERKLEELMEEKVECKSQLIIAQKLLKDVQNELHVEREQVKLLKEEIQQLHLEKERVANTPSISEAANEEAEKLQKNLDELHTAFDQLRGSKIEIEEEARKRQATLESDLDSTTTKLKDVIRRVEIAEGEQSSAEAALRRAKRENEELESERLQVEESLRKRIKSLQSQVEDLETNRDKLEHQKAAGEAERKKELDAFESYKKELKPQLHDLEQQRDSLRKANANLEADLTARTNELDNFKESVSLQERKISTINSEKMALDLKLDALHNDLTKSRAETQELITANEETKNQIQDLERQAREDAAERRRLHNTIQELKGNIRVFCRIRPPIGKEIESSNDEMFRYNEKGQGVVAKSPPNEPSVRIHQSYPFKFDRVFDPTSSQDTVFEEISQLVQSAIDGYRVCIFAYGQTGSGKTYTMLGERGGDDSNLGMVPRSIQQVFETARSMKKDGWTFDLKASFLEIYNESIRDLLVDNSANGGKSREHRVVYSQDKKSSSVTDLTVEAVKDEAHIQKLITQSMKNRATAATQSNERSSRSHSVFRLYVRGKNAGTRECREGLLNLIDLAGSERLEKSKAEGERLRETKHINKSLSALGDVISALSKKAGHVPYRNSKLTHLLQDSLGGDSKALMFVNLSHAPESFNESLCSLRFAAKVNNCHVGTAQRSAKIDL